MANIWIILISIGLAGVISHVNCATETFGDVTDKLVLKQNVVAKGDAFGSKTVIIEYPGKDSVSLLPFSIKIYPFGWCKCAIEIMTLFHSLSFCFVSDSNGIKHNINSWHCACG